MKTFRLLSMLLVTIALWSCSGSGSEEIPEPVIPDESKTYEIKMDLGGEYVETTESPLSRTDTPKKYYGVNVYCMKDDGSTDSYSNYAYGVFDDIEYMKLTLLDGYKYKFECTSVEDDEDKIYINEYKLLYNPFTYGSNNTPYQLSNINKFTISHEELSSIKRGNTYINNLNETYPRTNRYYGELENYIPTEDGIATISMKRTVFGLNMKVNAIPDGTLSWSIRSSKASVYYEYDYLSTKYSSHTGNEILEFSSIYTFSDVYKSWKNEDYTTDFTLVFSWRRGNGYSQSFSESISVKRNVMINVNVNLEGGSSEINLGINEENTEMTNETINVNFDGGSLSDTNLNPEE